MTAALPNPLDLTLHSVNEEDMVAAAVADIQGRILGWTPTEGAIEVALIEAVAILEGQSVYTLNQLPRVVMGGLLALNGLLRHTPVPASGVLAVTMATGTTGAKIVPAGTTFRVAPDSGDTFDVIAVTAVTQAPSDGLTFTVPVTAVLAGSAPNGVGPGTATSLVDALSWVESVDLYTPMVGGTDGEADDAFYQRGAAYLQARNSTLVVPSNFSVAALDVVGVGRAWAFNNWTGTTGNPGDQPGHVAVVVTTAAGAACSAPVKTAVANALTSNALAALTIHILDPAFYTATVTVNISVTPGFDGTDVQTRVAAAIRTYLDPANRELGALLPANQVIGLAAKVDGVAIVNTVGGATVGAARGRLDLPSPSPTITVTVT